MKIKFKSIIAFLFCMSVCMFSSCKDEKDQPDVSPNEPESGTVEDYDDLEWLSQSIIERDAEGNITQFIVGAQLDESNPGSITIGVENIDEASEIFKSWIAPGSEINLVTSEDGSMKYKMTSEEGLNQGTALFSTEAEDNRIAQVKFADGARIDGLNEINFILNSSWPTNAAGSFSPFMVGDVVNFDTDETDEKWDGMQKALVIREAKVDQCGIILYLSNQTWKCPGSHYYGGMVSLSMAQTCAKIIGGSSWKMWQIRYKDIGYDVQDNDYFWTDKIKVIPPFSHRRYAVKMSKEEPNKNTDWFDTMYKHPKKKYLMVKTFGVVYE